MPSHQALKDDQLLAEVYSGMAGGSLLLETPATAANIDRFIKKYFDNSIFNPPGLEGDRAAMQRAANGHGAKAFLEKWTPRLQQIIKAAGGNPDIFAYPSLAELQRVMAASETSKTDEKKAYKKAQIDNLPLVLETEAYNAYQPLTWEVSRKYFGINRTSVLDGTQKKGSHWCTAASEKDKFYQYVVKGKNRLIYFVRKKDDKLFAARSLATTEEYYQKWLKKVDLILNKINKIETNPEFITAAKERNNRKLSPIDKEKHRWQYTRFEMEIYKLATDMRPKKLVECRNQKNDLIFRPISLYTELNPNTSRDINGYVNFLKFVVFGKTE